MLKLVVPQNMWAAAVSGFLAAQRAAGRPATTIETRRQHLQRVSDGLGGSPWDVDVAALVGWLADRSWSQETRRSYRTTLRAFYRWGIAAGYTDHDVGAELPAVRASRPNPRPVPDAMYEMALATASERVRLMIRMAGELGMRRAEVATAHTDDLIPDLEGWSLLIHGKGGKDRTVPLPPGLMAILTAFTRGYFFPGDIGGHLSPRHVGILVSRCLPAGWSMHKLRHRAASRWYGVDRDVFVVQDLLGHASPATTRAYVKIPNDSARRTVNAAA